MWRSPHQFSLRCGEIRFRHTKKLPEFGQKLGTFLRFRKILSTKLGKICTDSGSWMPLPTATPANPEDHFRLRVRLRENLADSTASDSGSDSDSGTLLVAKNLDVCPLPHPWFLPEPKQWRTSSIQLVPEEFFEGLFSSEFRVVNNEKKVRLNQGSRSPDNF